MCKTTLYRKVQKYRKDEYGRWETYDAYESDSSRFPVGHGEKSVIMLLQLGLKLKKEEIEVDLSREIIDKLTYDKVTDKIERDMSVVERQAISEAKITLNAAVTKEINEQYGNTKGVVEEALRKKAADLDINGMKRDIENPDMMLGQVGRIVNQNPTMVSCGVLFKPDYYPQKGRFYVPFASRDSLGTVHIERIDSIYTRYNMFGFDFNFVDTAGLRKKSKVYEDLEFYSVMRSIRSIENSDVCILMLDASQGLEQQDINIFSLIQRNNKGLVVVMNKWDLVEKNNNTHREFEELIRSRIAPFDDVPIVFTSVLNKQRVFKVLETAKQVYESRSRRIPTSELNELLLPIVKEQNPPPSVKGKWIKIKYVTQLPTHYPQFVFFCNLPQYIRDPYKRYVENRIREIWDFHGVPISIFFRAK